MSLFQRKVYCQYCNRKTKYVDSKLIYNTSYGMIWYCKNCDAYVGVHKGTDIPLGTLANEQLRKWRVIAHNELDALWKSGQMTRTQAYRYLSSVMGMEKAHIGSFSIEECQRFVQLIYKQGNNAYDKIHE